MQKIRSQQLDKPDGRCKALAEVDGSPDGIVKLLGSIGGTNDDDSLRATCHAVKLHQELGLEPTACLMLPSGAL